MKFSPCTGGCTGGTDDCQGCGRSRAEIKDTQAVVAKMVEHIIAYGYDDPEVFLAMLTKKSLRNLGRIKEQQGSANEKK